MRSLTSASAAALGLIATATAIAPTTTIAQRDSPKVLAARAWNSDGAYLVNTTLGTPGQHVSLLLDINATRHTFNFAWGTQNCSQADDRLECLQYGSYAPNASSTWAWGERYVYEVRDNEWAVAFGDESDLLTLGPEGDQRTLNVSVYPALRDPNDVMNVMAASGNASGISILNDLVDADIIDSRSFSLWNNPVIDQESELLFGGVNTAQYRGKLQTYAMKEDGVPRLPVTSLQVTSSDEEETRNISLPETQFTVSTIYYTVLPKNVAAQLYEAYNITGRTLPCSRQNENRTIALKVGETTIETPWSYLLYQIGDSDGCLFGPWDGGEGDNAGKTIIGIEFLRSMYLALDYDAGKVGVAELNTAPGEDDFRSLEDAEGVQGSSGESGSGSGSESGEGDGDTGAAGRMSIPGFGILAAVGGVGLALL